MDNRPIAVYDANVLYPAQLRDLLMRLAIHDVVRPHWSEQIHDEWMRNVHADYDDVTWGDLEHTRRQMDKALPDACVEGYQNRISNLSLPDPDDRHVLAAAVHIGADYIVTFNLEDFPESELDSYGIEAIDPDTFACLLMSRREGRVIHAASQHRNSLRHPPLSPDEYLAVLRNAGLTETAQRLQSNKKRL